MPNFLIVMENGKETAISSELSMYELSNELRSKLKVAVKKVSGEKLSLESKEVRSIEHYRVREGLKHGDSEL